MNSWKKIASTLLALAMTASLGTTAFASSGTTDPSEVETTPVEPTPITITVENASKGATYTAYKLFDANVNGTGGIVYTGDIPKDTFTWEVTGEGGTTTTVSHSLSEYFVKDAKSGEITAKEKALSTDAIATLKAWAKKQTSYAAQDKGAGGPLKLDVTEAGYGYYVVTSTIDSGAAITVDSTNPTASIYDKNNAGEPTFPTDGKTADGSTFDLGSTVTYTVKFNTVNWIGSGETAKRVTEYTITDTATTNYLGNVTVESITIGGKDYKVSKTNDDGSTTQVVPQFENNKITFKWVNDKNESLYDNGAQIVINYTATVTGTGAGKNTVSATYKTDGNDTPVPTKPEVTVYNSTITVDKYTMTGENKDVNTKLANAKFVLAKKVEGAAVEDEVDNMEIESMKFYAISEDNVVSWVDNIDDATEVTTNDKGFAEFKGLKDGTYYLIETEAPAGYNLATEPTEIVINAADETEVNGNKTHVTSYTGHVLNNTGAELPSTGGIGTTIFYVGGGILIAAAGILLVTKKRMSAAA